MRVADLFTQKKFVPIHNMQLFSLSFNLDLGRSAVIKLAYSNNHADNKQSSYAAMGALDDVFAN